MEPYTFHPAAAFFPLHTPEEFTELLGSLRQYGYDTSHPIVLCDGAILDGRNRYTACQELGLEPTFLTYTGNPFAKAWLENGSRRDLHAGQKAAIRLQINLASDEWQMDQVRRREEANAKRSEAAQSQPRRELQHGSIGFSGVLQDCKTPEHSEQTFPIQNQKQDQSQTTPHAKSVRRPQGDFTHTRLAHEAGVSPRTAAQTITIAKKSPALLDKVAKGELSLQDATKQANTEVIRTRAGALWTPFEVERRRWVEELGYPTLANYHCDPHLLDWAKATGRHVFIGRGSLWGNPFEMGKDGTRTYVIESYALYYFPRKPSLQAMLAQLAGKVLECYCVPERCHGEILIEMLSRAAWDLLDTFLKDDEPIEEGLYDHAE
jgi:hypothetical protein